MIGNDTDSHFRTVAERVREHDLEPIIFDADSLTQVKYSLSQDGLNIGGKGIPKGTRAWFRRAAPSRWSTGDLVGSVSDVSLRARVALIAAIARSCGYTWLTGIEALLAAEDRMHQLAVAQRIGITVPRTIVSSDPIEILHALGDDVVLKPLASGAFVNSEGEPHAVYTTPLTPELVASGNFGPAPFVAQQRIHVYQHLRVVTAGNVATTAILDADRWPIDWRTADEAHTSWAAHKSTDIEAQALRLAAELGVGFSSQDWLLSKEGPPTFIDLNPAGQWMFLPDAVAKPITDSIVDFLCGQS